jgi:putative phosphoribosyl transferase
MKFPSPIYKDRADAGKKLGQKLKTLNLKKPVVVAIPSGGVPVGKEVTKFLNCPFDLITVRKIQYPWTTEAGFGAVAADGTIYIGPRAEGLNDQIIKEQTEKAQREVKHRKKLFLKDKKEINLKDKAVILVDDGLAVGSTMLTTVQSVKKRKPKKIIVAVPTASANAVRLIEPHVNKLISLYTHPVNLPFAVASSYYYWHDLSDEEVLSFIKSP